MKKREPDKPGWASRIAGAGLLAGGGIAAGMLMRGKGARIAGAMRRRFRSTAASAPRTAFKTPPPAAAAPRPSVAPKSAAPSPAPKPQQFHGPPPAHGPEPTTDLGQRRRKALNNWVSHIHDHVGKTVKFRDDINQLHHSKGQIIASHGKDGGATDAHVEWAKNIVEPIVAGEPIGLKKRDTTGLLSAAEHQQRVAAARSPRHHAETAISVRQGSTGAPSKAAIGLFRQGQQRSDTRASRSVWDTRGTEQAVGSMNARFKLHLPQAYRSTLPDSLLTYPTGRRLLAEALAEPPKKKGKQKVGPHRDLTIENPSTFTEAMRHPRMVEILRRSIGVVRDHQKGAVEYGYKKGLIPKGTPPGLAARAYKHAALMAVHKVGVGHYDFAMDATMQRELEPLRLFMQYAHRRVFDPVHTENQPETFEPFKREFGKKFSSRKHGKLTGTERYRMSPNNVFIKRAPLTRVLRIAGQHIGDLIRRPTAIGKKPSFPEIK